MAIVKHTSPPHKQSTTKKHASHRKVVLFTDKDIEVLRSNREAFKNGNQKERGRVWRDAWTKIKGAHKNFDNTKLAALKRVSDFLLLQSN